MKRTPAGLASICNVREHSDPELDWTPQALRVRPRIVQVKKGSMIAEVEECRNETSDGEGTDYCFIVGVGNGKGEPKMNIFGVEMTPAELDDMLELLTLARDKAKSLGMPSAKR